MTSPLRLGIAGLGTVGGGLLQILATHAASLTAKATRPLQVTAVCARDKSKDRGIDLSAWQWYDDPRQLAASEHIDVFVELMGGEDGITKEAVEQALSNGKHVVTANKALLAHHGTALAKLAEDNGVALNFEAAVAGSIPIVKTMRESLSGNEITRVYGILNGTCNYILTKMQREQRAFEDVLKEAQAAGYAEADPTFDIGGHDTAHKLAILTSLAFGTEISFDSIYLEGIQAITPEDISAADELGYKIKLLGVAVRTPSGIEQRVHPTMVPKHTAIAQVDGVTNCVAVDGDFVGDIMLIGPGAGAGPTASSVIGDIVDIARGLIVAPLNTRASALKPYSRARMRAHEGGYYIRLRVYDHVGAFAAIATRMSEHGISLESIVQKRPPEALPGLGNKREVGALTTVVMITHQTTEEAVSQALSAIEADGHVEPSPQMIRIEKL